MSAIEEGKKRNLQVKHGFQTAKDRERAGRQRLADQAVRRQQEAEEKAKQQSKWSWLASAGKGALAGLIGSGGNPFGALIGGVGGGLLDRVAGSAGPGLVNELAPMAAQGGQAYAQSQPQERLLEQMDMAQQDQGASQFDDWETNSWENGSNWQDPRKKYGPQGGGGSYSNIA